MSKGNPNHPVVREMEMQWHKFCALLIHMRGVDSITITAEDLNRFAASGATNIIVDTRGGINMTLRLVSDAEAARLARAEGGLPQ